MPKTGFSLVEMLLTVAIFGLLISLGLPAFSVYVANTRVRADAQNLVAGVQKARAEAVARNVAVDLVITNGALVALDPATGVANGRNWVVQTSTVPRVFIEGKLGADEEGGSTVRLNDVDADGVADVGSIAAITFNGTGGTNLAGNITFRYTSSAAKCANPAGRTVADFPGSVQTTDSPPTSDLRCLNVVVTRGGAARICDPAVVPSVGDTRSCS